MQGVVHKRLEHRRRQALEIEIGRAGDGARQELWRVFKHVHEGVGVLQHACRHHFRGALIPEKKDRQPVVAPALRRENLLKNLPLRRRVLELRRRKRSSTIRY